MSNQKFDFEPKLREALEIVRQLFPQLVSDQSQDIAVFREQASEVSKKAKENQELALEYLHEADVDLRVSKLLRHKKFYARSAHSLQQAVEKANKAWALGFGIIDRTELIRISHKTPMTLLKILRQEKIKPLILLIQQTGPSFSTDIEPVWQLIKRRSHPDIARMGEAEIESHLSETKIIDNTAAFIDNVITMGIKSFEPNVKPPQLGQLICIGMSLFILGVITFPHEAYTRYPGGEVKAGKLSPRDYDSNLGIIKSMPKIERMLASKIKLLNNLLT